MLSNTQVLIINLSYLWQEQPNRTSNFKEYHTGADTSDQRHNNHRSGLIWVSRIPTYVVYLHNRYRQRFFDCDGHETMYASSGKKHYFTKSCHQQIYQNYGQPP